jgi:tRNA-dihydrouridine synthase B
VAETVSAIFARNPVLLAPMAGVTEAPFRGICKRFGAGLTYTEMVSVKALHFTPDGRRTRELLRFDPDETPCAVQVYGAEPALMAEQVAMLLERYRDEISVVDINMGCPVTKVVTKGEGSALMRDPALAAAVVSAVVAASSVPVTVKIRSGWDAGEVNAAEFARAMEAAGACAVGVHGRTRGQFYRGRADWGVIGAVKQAVSIPVAGSGDLFSAADVVAMLEQTGADAAMVARGAQGNPWIFREATALLEGGEPLAPPTPLERVDLAREHAARLVAFAGDHAFVRMRKHVAWYIAEMPGATHVRSKVNHCRSYAELDGLLAEYRAYLESR